MSRPPSSFMPRSVYRYIWNVSGHQQIMLCLLTGVVIGLSALPLELQRRIIDDAFGKKDVGLLAVYCTLYLILLLDRKSVV